MSTRGKDEKFVNEFSERLKNLIGERSCASVAREIGMTNNAVWSYVNGLTLPSLSALVRLASALGVTTDYLLTGRSAAIVPYDRQTLKDVVEAVAEHLERERLSPSPEKLAEFIALAYEEMMGDEEHRDEPKARILQFVRLAS